MPVTAASRRPAVSAASACARCTTVEAALAGRGELRVGLPDARTTRPRWPARRAGAPASWPTATRAPSARSASTARESFASDPDTATPRASRIRAMPLIPAPPMPTRCTRSASSAPSSAAPRLRVPHRSAGQHRVVAPDRDRAPISRAMRRAARRRRRARRRGPRRPSRPAGRGSVSSGTSSASTRSPVSSASATSTPPPAATTGRGVERLLAVAVRERHVDRGQPDGGHLGDGHRAGPAEHRVGGGVGQVHSSM